MYKTKYESVEWIPFLVLYKDGDEVVRHCVLSIMQAQFVESYYYLIEEQEKINKNPFPNREELEKVSNYLSEKYNKVYELQSWDQGEGSRVEEKLK